MSTPLTAPKPDMPTGTSNPVSWKGWFNKIGDWINGLSPSGATVYDTGWLDIVPAAGYEHYSPGSKAQARRIGKEISYRGGIKPVSGNFSTAAELNIGTVPTGLYPTRGFVDSISALWGHAGSTTIQVIYGYISTGGAIQIRVPTGLTIGYVALKGFGPLTVD